MKKLIEECLHRCLECATLFFSPLFLFFLFLFLSTTTTNHYQPLLPAYKRSNGMDAPRLVVIQAGLFNAGDGK